MWRLLLSFFFICLVSSIQIDPIDDVEWPPRDLTINTQYGPVKGYSRDGADIWHGIPFAKPPLGQYRFRPPQVPDSWEDAIDCSDRSPICPQLDFENRRTVGQEDCLYLDIYRPAGATGPLPVMFWIYGGGFVVGDSYEFGTYDGSHRVSDYPVIMVNVNYRLNAFGFLALEELRNESSSGTSGNYGVQDQRFALQWVQENIANFGGDPNQVTIYGQSAGAFSVCYHVSSPASKGLFRSAIMESGTCDAKEFFLDFKLADSWSADVASWSGCNRTQLSHDDYLNCLRFDTTTVDWMSTVLSWFTGFWDKSGTGYRPLLAPMMPWALAIDGSYEGLLDVPLELIKQQAGSQVPLIAGTNADEGSIFIPALPMIVPDVRFPISEADVNITLLHFFDNSQTTVNSILEHYPLGSYSDPSEQAAIILRDYFFVCPTRRVHRATHDEGLPSWQYHFTYEYHHPVEFKEFGDYHTAELKYVWDNFRTHETYKDSKMVDSFGYYWMNTGMYQDPNYLNGTDQIFWPTYDPNTDNLINMTVPCSLKDHYFTSICDFWDTIYPN